MYSCILVGSIFGYLKVLSISEGSVFMIILVISRDLNLHLRSFNYPGLLLFANVTFKILDRWVRISDVLSLNVDTNLYKHFYLFHIS